MALSNWDTLSVDLNSNPTNGSFTSPMGVEVSFYKNWIYVRDPKAHREGAFTDNVVMQVDEGVIQYQDVEIHAIRGPQNGIYAVVTHGYGKNMTGMIGAGVYGYGDEETDGTDEDGYAPFVGVRESSKDFLQQWISRKQFNSRQDALNYLDEWIHADYIPSEKDIQEILSRTTFDKMIANVDLKKATRFNQGDAFFKGAETSQTDVGEAKETILSQIIKGTKYETQNPEN